MATRDERRNDIQRKRWQNRKSPLELGRHHAKLGKPRDSNPFSDSLPQSRADWFEGWDASQN